LNYISLIREGKLKTLGSKILSSKGKKREEEGCNVIGKASHGGGGEEASRSLFFAYGGDVPFEKSEQGKG